MKKELHIRMAVGQGQINKLIQQKNKEIGLLPGQAKILEYINDYDGCSQNDLCDAWDLDKSTVSGLVTRMERDGLIVIRASKLDHRRKVIHLTNLGKEKWDRIGVCIHDIDEAAFRGIPLKEQESFFTTLEKMYSNLSDNISIS